jgi:hypothetical protein
MKPASYHRQKAGTAAAKSLKIVCRLIEELKLLIPEQVGH